jgi:hypothetical protein
LEVNIVNDIGKYFLLSLVVICRLMEYNIVELTELIKVGSTRGQLAFITLLAQLLMFEASV